jgi:prevent-host-death family protein
MKAITAADAKNAFGSFLDAVQHEPVVVTKQNRPVGVMISMQDVKTLSPALSPKPASMSG